MISDGLEINSLMAVYNTRKDGHIELMCPLFVSWKLQFTLIGFNH